ANTIGSKTVRMPNADMAAPKNPYTMDYFGNKGFSVLSENPPSLYVSLFARSATMASPASQGKLLGHIRQPATKHPFHRVPVSESCRSKLECSGAFVPVRSPRKIQKSRKTRIR